LKQQNKDIQT